ncbi:hypothetical protein NST83_05305 [Paenibacillus sp. FSL R10-2782]|uniref:hypothetical protein n=1 Tax=Paenibacillus sp. FSL R10-2782 TaxID=2954661 RepID=UPI00315932E9
MKNVRAKYATAFLSSMVLVGSLSGLSMANAGTQNPSVYQSITKFKKSESQGQVIWKEKNITVTAKKTELKNVPGSEKSVITSITIQKGEKIYTIKTDGFDDKLRDISSISVSPSNDWLAIQTRRSAGETVLLMDLKNGKHQILNDQLSAAGKKNIETINSYNWSPKTDQLAFSYGDPARSSIAIYDSPKGTFTFLPRETDYISTSLILWNKNGDQLNYISEYPSDQKRLYTYSMITKKVKTVKKISEKEFQQWLKLDK